VRDCLSQLGYNVLEVGSGEAALELCARKQGQIDLVMTDLVMPGMGGQEMGKQLAERFPSIQVLYTSGYTEDSVARREILQEESSFLAKPFSVSELSSAVYRILSLRSHPTDQHDTEAVAHTTA